MKIVFRTNAGEEGLGHLNRIYALYKAFEIASNDTKIFLVNESAKHKLLELGVNNENIIISEAYDEGDIDILKKISLDVLIVDTYKATNEYIKKIKKSMNPVFVIFDDNNRYTNIEVDILINGNIYAHQLDYKNKIKYHKGLLGSKYLIMNPVFWNIDSKYPQKMADLLITCGGADPVNIMPKLVNYLKNIKMKKKIVIGPYFNKEQIKSIENNMNDSFEMIYKPKHLKEHIKMSDIVFTASGSTVYEVLAMKRIPIIFVIGKDQELIARDLEEKGIINLGWYHKIKDNMADIIEKAKREEYIMALSKIYPIFDGKGVLRAVKEITAYMNRAWR